MKLLLALLLLLSSCNWDSLDTKKSWMHKISPNMAESKANGVFRGVVHVNKSILSIGNNITDTIKEAWIEDMWMYNDDGGIVKDSAQQLQLLLGNSSNAYNDKLLLRCRDKYFGWNGVFSTDLHCINGTVYVVSVVSAAPNIHTIRDSFVVIK
jgi:hypothetical protein